jgi:phosphatidate cytidylyltransferase
MKRILTAAVGLPIAVAAMLYLQGWWFFLFALAVIEWAVLEFVEIGRRWVPHAPLQVLLLLVPLAGLAVTWGLAPDRASSGALWLMGAGLSVSVLTGSLVLLARVPIQESVVTLGLLSFAVPYFALPLASLYALQRMDPWLLVVLCALVWLGDSAAYYVGCLFGRRKMAPAVSPKKTWEGAAAGFLCATGVVAAWSLWLEQRLAPELLLLGALTAVAAQLGDLVESMLKRNAGIKDSGSLLPGHGGMFDRLDALLFAAPVWYFGLLLLTGRGAAP